jgi:hypothetical protein
MPPFDLLDQDALSVLLGHLDGIAFERLAAVSSALRRRLMEASEALWAERFGGERTFERAAAANADADGRSKVTRALRTRALTLANWRTSNPIVARLVLVPTERSGMVTTLALSDRLLASGGCDHCVRLWDLAADGAAVRTLRGHTGAIRCLLFGAPHTRTLFSGAWDKTIRVWDLESGACARELSGAHERALMALALASEHVLVSAGGEGRVVWWDLRTGARVRTRRRDSPVLALTVGVEGTRAQYADGSSRLFRTPLEPEQASRGLGLEPETALRGSISADADSDSGAPLRWSNFDPAFAGAAGCAANKSEWLVEPIDVHAPPAQTAAQLALARTPRMLPNGTPLPAELQALYAASQNTSRFVDGAAAADGSVALCTRDELLLLGRVGGARAARSAATTCAHVLPAVSPGSGLCCALLPEAGLALFGCSTCVCLHALPPRAGRHVAPPARLALSASPSALLARWDMCVVGLPGGQIVVFELAHGRAAAGGGAGAGGGFGERFGNGGGVIGVLIARTQLRPQLVAAVCVALLALVAAAAFQRAA